MNLDLGSFAFGSVIASGGGTPSWGTSLGQSKPDYKFTYLGANDILIGMVYCSVPLETVSLPLGKGGHVENASNQPECQIASLFRKVYINGKQIPYPFILVQIKETSDSHLGRRTIKYSDKNSYDDGSEHFSNGEFIRSAREILEIAENACWFIYRFDVCNQDELHMFAVIVNKENSVTYADSSTRRGEWLDLLSEKSVPFSIQQVISDIDSTGLLYTPELIKRFAFSLMSKQFLILSGLAGSGKTQLTLAFASALIGDDSQLCIVPVGADWTNREPLLGYPNALKEGEYVKPDNGVLDLLIEASMPENASKPYFLILDEMNMSYVERYFADFLSVMESHKEMPLWNSSNENAPRSVALPKNLFIIGTINVDETTYMFSPKVLDRANVIEFKILSDEMEMFLDEMKPIDMESIKYKDAGMGASFVELAGKAELADNDDSIKKALVSFFRNLKSVNAEFGYRSATEIYRFIWQAKNNDDTPSRMTDNEILDCAIVQKLLPKLHGSRKKLDPVLLALWKECFDADRKETTIISEDYIKEAKYPLTADKIQRMSASANANGFTSFAEA